MIRALWYNRAVRSRVILWLAVFALWTLLVVVFAVSSSLTFALSYQPPRWRYTLTMAATEWYVWAAFTPLVVWLGSAASAHVTGRVFEVEGGRIGLADGWRYGLRRERGRRWEVAEAGKAVLDLLAEAEPPTPVYGGS